MFIATVASGGTPQSYKGDDKAIYKSCFVVILLAGACFFALSPRRSRGLALARGQIAPKAGMTKQHMKM